MDSEPISFAGQVLALSDRGYNRREILAELKTRPGMGKTSLSRVDAVLRQTHGRSLDSRRIAEIHEAMLEVLGTVRELLNERQKRKVPGRIRTAERELTGS